MSKKIHRRCKYGCGEIANYGKKYIHGHHAFGITNSLGYKHSDETKKKISLSETGKKHSEETKLKMSLAKQNMSEEHKKNS